MQQDDEHISNADDEVMAEAAASHSTTGAAGVKKTRVVKNLLVVSFSWVFLFIGFFSLANLQSSLNSDANLGTLCLSVIYITLVVGSTFFPKLLVSIFGLKWTIVVAQFGYLIYLCANLYANWFTLLPASVLLGLASSALWVAKNLYVKEIYLIETASETRKNVDNTKDDVTITLNRYMSVFFGLFLSSQIWANMISSLILKPELPSTKSSLSNVSKTMVSTTVQCGSNACPRDWNELPLVKPTMNSVYILIGVLVLSNIISILINVIFLDNLSQTKSRSETVEEKHPVKKFFKQLTHKYQLLITPFSLWIGFIQGFMSADFTKYFVACLFGIHQVGFYAMFYGIFLTIGCIFNGVLIKHIGRIVSLLIGSFFYFPTLFVMLFWQNPSPEYFYSFFILAGLMGIGVSFWEPNVNAAIGIYFPKSSEEAFSVFKLWESAGFFITYLYSSYLCVWLKIYILIGVGSLSAFGYLTIEILRRKSNKNKI